MVNIPATEPLNYWPSPASYSVHRILIVFILLGGPQDVPHQAEAGQEAEAKQADSPLDPHENGQQDPVNITTASAS